MNARELKTEIIELRMTEMEVREQLLSFLGEVHASRLWREYGYSSFSDYFSKELGYDRADTRDVLVRLGVILPSSELHSEDPETQERIERLRTWRKEEARIRGVATYRVLTNRSLLEIAERNPKTIEELRAIRGMGEKKCAAYGNELLAIGATVAWTRANGFSPSASIRSP